MSSRDLWTSRLGFILASAGAAVGLGAIWKFPYMAGTNGGAAFIIPYILFVLPLACFCCWPKWLLAVQDVPPQLTA